MALTAKDSLSNLFGGLALTLDAPFKPGDSIVLDDGERGKVVFITFAEKNITIPFPQRDVHLQH